MRLFTFNIFFIFFIVPALANNEVRIYKQGNFNCISSNGSPNHEIGKFPTKGNPNKFKAQKINYCYPNNPIKKRTFNNRASIVGITLTGIPIRPGAADWYDASSPRLHSRNKSSGWNLEAITPNRKIFGIDENNAHVDNKGLYHYHGMPEVLQNFNGKIQKNKVFLGFSGFSWFFLIFSWIFTFSRR